MRSFLVALLLAVAVTTGLAIQPAVAGLTGIPTSARASTGALVGNPTTLAFKYSATLAPHPSTLRFEYIVPIGRELIIETVQVGVEFDGLATGGARSSTETLVAVWPAGTSNGSIVTMYTAYLWSTIDYGAKHKIAVAPHKRLGPGDHFLGYTVNEKIGGSALHAIFVTATERDVS